MRQAQGGEESVSCRYHPSDGSFRGESDRSRISDEELAIRLSRGEGVGTLAQAEKDHEAEMREPDQQHRKELKR